MSDSETVTLADAVRRYEPAPDVQDLDTARRLITALRERISLAAKEYEEATTPEPGEYTAFLDSDHATRLEWLYQARRLLLTRADDPYWLDPPDLVEAFTDFVEMAIDIAWDMAQTDQGLPERPPMA